MSLVTTIYAKILPVVRIQAGIGNIKLNMPSLFSAMDIAVENKMAIALTLLNGTGTSDVMVSNIFAEL